MKPVDQAVEMASQPNAAGSYRPHRIAFCLPKTTGGADLLQQMQIAKGLQARGHDLTFVAPLDLQETICTKDLQEHTLVRRTWSAAAWFQMIRKLSWKLQMLLRVPYLNVFSNYAYYDACLQCLPGHDLVQERNGLYKMGVAMACKRLRLPYLLFFDADDIFELDFLGEPLTGILRYRARQIIQYTLSAANGIVCVSEATKNRLVTIWQVPEEKIAVFPNAVDVDIVRPYPEKRHETRASLRVGDAPLVIYVGNFYAWHDVATLIDAFPQVLAVYPDAHLLLVGDGKPRQALQEKAAALGISHSVTFTGLRPRHEVPYLISAADVAVSPYPKMEQAWWGSSMKLFEYLASGTAVVASDVGEQVSQVIQDGRNGLLVPPADPSALASVITQLIADPELRCRLGIEGRQDAEKKYSWKEYILRLERVHQAVIQRQPIHLI